MCEVFLPTRPGAGGNTREVRTELSECYLIPHTALAGEVEKPRQTRQRAFPRFQEAWLILW